MFLGFVVYNPVESVLLRECVLFVRLCVLALLDTGLESSIILVHSCGFQVSIGLVWIGDTHTALDLISIVIIIVAGDDVSYVLSSDSLSEFSFVG